MTDERDSLPNAISFEDTIKSLLDHGSQVGSLAASPLPRAPAHHSVGILLQGIASRQESNEPETQEQKFVGLAKLIFDLAGEFGSKAEESRRRDAERARIDPKEWEASKHVFDLLCKVLSKCRSIRKEPPDGLQAVAEVWERLDKLSATLWKTMNTKEGIELAVWTDEGSGFLSLASEGQKLIMELDESDDPFGFLDDSRQFKANERRKPNAKLDKGLNRKGAKPEAMGNQTTPDGKLSQSDKSAMEAERFRQEMLKHHLDRDGNLLFTAIDRQTLCHRLGISQSTLTRRFQDVWGITWKKYLSMCQPNDKSMTELKRQIEFLRDGTTESAYLERVASDKKAFGDLIKTQGAILDSEE